MAPLLRSSASERREKLRAQHWSNEEPWTGQNEKGWFRALRTLPLFISLLNEKQLSGRLNLTTVYLDLLARHIDGGIIEMGHELDHAYAAGFRGRRALRTWRERMRRLEKLGVIRTIKSGNEDFSLVLLLHPTFVIHKLREEHKVSDPWWNAYQRRQAETHEQTYEERLAAKKAAAKVVNIGAKAAKKKAAAAGKP